MPIPFLLVGAAAVAGITGVAKGAQAIKNNSEAKSKIEEAQSLYDSAKGKLETQRNSTTTHLENLGKIKLETWSQEVNDFLNTFNAFNNVRMEGKVNLNERLKGQITNPQNMLNMTTATLKAREVAKAGFASLGAGALAGVASYGGAMMFASASTGTAIASLSGAAATNATLAWFGGGALKAGGLGMAGGSAVLGGIVAGPVLAVAGFIMAAKSEENLARAEETYAEAEQAVEKMEIMRDFMKQISEISDDYRDFIDEFRKRFRHVINQINDVKYNAMQRQVDTQNDSSYKQLAHGRKIDFDSLSIREQETLHISWLMAQVIYSVLSAPLLTKNGDLDKNVRKILQDANDAIPEIERAQEELQYLPDDIPRFNEQISLQSVEVQGEVEQPVASEEHENHMESGWQVFNFVVIVFNFIFAIKYFFSGFGLFGESFIGAVLYIVAAGIFCPFVARKKDISSKEKFKYNFKRLIIGWILLAIVNLLFL